MVLLGEVGLNQDCVRWRRHLKNRTVLLVLARGIYLVAFQKMQRRQVWQPKLARANFMDIGAMTRKSFDQDGECFFVYLAQIVNFL